MLIFHRFQARDDIMPPLPPPIHDHVIPFSTTDGGMNHAIEQARQTLPKFFQALHHPTASQTGFCLKVRFESGGQIEHIWLADIDTSKSPLEGTIGNEPELKASSLCSG